MKSESYASAQHPQHRQETLLPAKALQAELKSRQFVDLWALFVGQTSLVSQTTQTSSHFRFAVSRDMNSLDPCRAMEALRYMSLRFRVLVQSPLLTRLALRS